jgi:hypothetical protein
MITMRWSLTLQITGSPAVAVASPPVEVEAIDRVEAVIAPGDSDKVLEIQPGASASVRLLLITSSRYGSDLSFKVSDGATDSDPVTLDSPQVFSGSAVTLFGVAPQQLKFSNTSADQPATVAIQVARDATP